MKHGLLDEKGRNATGRITEAEAMRKNIKIYRAEPHARILRSAALDEQAGKVFIDFTDDTIKITEQSKVDKKR